MAGFCVSCGAPMTGVFCNRCGAKAVAPTVPAAQPGTNYASPSSAQPVAPQVSQSVAPAAKGSGLGKVLAIVGGVLVLLFVIGVGAALYGAYWVKHKVATYSAAVSGRPSETEKVVANGNSCQLLSTAELQQALGVTIERSAEIVDGSAKGCAYYTNQQAFSQLQRMAAEQVRRQTQEANSQPGPKSNDLGSLLKNPNQMEGIVKTLALTQPVEDGQVFSFTVERNVGEDAWSSARLVEAAVPGFEEVKGVGDRAMIGSFGHAFYVLKGNSVVHMNTTWVPDAREHGSQLAQMIIGHL